MSKIEKLKKKKELVKEVELGKGMFDQKPYIIDKENRIMEFKASNGDVDSDGDRINIHGWSIRKGAVLVDSHQTKDSIDRVLGYILEGYVKGNNWMNKVQFKNPNFDADGNKRDPNEWTAGEKLANSLWIEIEKGADVRVSVGFMPDFEKASLNEYDGIDFEKQIQYELSPVSVPANEGAGNKSAIKNKELEISTEIFKTEFEKYISPIKEQIKQLTKTVQDLQADKVKKELKPNLTAKKKSLTDIKAEVKKKSLKEIKKDI